MNPPNSPGFLGSVLAVLISFVTFGVLVGCYAMFSADDPLQALAILVLYTSVGAMMAGTYGLPVAVVGAVLLTLCLRRVPEQGVHVLAAVAVGAVLTGIYLGVLLGGDPSVVLLSVAVGLAAGVGRLSVIPLVTSRRRLAAAARLTGTARW